MVVGDETQVGNPLLRTRQGYFLVSGCLELGGGLQGGGCGCGQEVLSRGGGVPRGQGMWTICMGEGGGYAPGCGWLGPFVKG